MAKPYKTTQHAKYSLFDGLSQPDSRTTDYTGKTPAEIHQDLFEQKNVMAYVTFDTPIDLIDGKEKEAAVENVSPMTYFGEIIPLDNLVPDEKSTSKTLAREFARSAPYVAEQKAKGITHAVLLLSGQAVPLAADSRVFNKENRQVWPIGEKPAIRIKPQM